MKLFRISKVEEFFNSYPNAVELFGKINKTFEEGIDNPSKGFFLGMQTRFGGEVVKVYARLNSIVFFGDYEIYNYEIDEQ